RLLDTPVQLALQIALCHLSLSVLGNLDQQQPVAREELRREGPPLPLPARLAITAAQPHPARVPGPGAEGAAQQEQARAAHILAAVGQVQRGRVLAVPRLPGRPAAPPLLRSRRSEDS